MEGTPLPPFCVALLGATNCWGAVRARQFPGPAGGKIGGQDEGRGHGQGKEQEDTACGEGGADLGGQVGYSRTRGRDGRCGCDSDAKPEAGAHLVEGVHQARCRAGVG